MEVQLARKANNLDAELLVKLEKADYKAEVEKELKRHKDQMSMPGFRKGKVPMNLLWKMAGTDVKKQVVPQVINQAVQDYINDHELKLVLNPLEQHGPEDIDWEQEAFEFKYDIGIRPEINLDYEELKQIPFYKIEASEEEVKKQIEQIQNIKGESEEKEAVVDEKDLHVKFSITELDEDGSPLEGGLDKRKTEKISEFPDSLKQEFLGKEKESFTLKLKPHFESDEQLAEFLDSDQLTVQDLNEDFLITLESIYHFTPAELNEELYKAISDDEEIDNYEDFWNKVKELIEESYKRDAENQLFNQLKEHILNNLEIELPEEFMQKWFSRVNQEQEHEPEDPESEFDKFQRDIKWMLVIEYLGEYYNIEVSENEVIEHTKSMIRNEVAKMGIGDFGEDKIQNYALEHLKDQNNYHKTLYTLREAKVFDKLKEDIDFKEEPISYEEFQKLTQNQENQEKVTQNDE